MKDMTLEAYYNEKEYNILNRVDVKVKVKKNKYNISLDKLFNMAHRKNKKRSFLFVSKVLGKHIPVSPALSLLAGTALATSYLEEVYDDRSENIDQIISAIKGEQDANGVYQEFLNNKLKLPEETLFIGFAETATALGHSVFSSFADNNYYIHTTREEIFDFENNIKFYEEHSHATDHNLYPLDNKLLESDMPIVLVDDEITTGKTTINIIKAIHAKYPRGSYSILSLLDWRNDENRNRYQKLEEELDIKINTVSLISGNIEVKKREVDNLDNEIISSNNLNQETFIDYIYLDDYFSIERDIESAVKYKDINQVTYLNYTGRFGVSFREEKKLLGLSQEIGDYLKKYRTAKTLCMGTGEFMYVPMLISAHMGDDLYYQSTTRSPIYPSNKEDYGAKNSFRFNSPYHTEVINYFYNIPYGYYDDIFIFFEREVSSERLEGFLEQVKKVGADNVYIIFCSKKKEKVV